MDIPTLLKAAAAVITPLLALIGIAGRRKRLRSEIRDDLVLLEELRKEELLVQHSPVVAWMAGKIALDTARLTRQPLGPKKKPIAWASVILAAVFGIAAALWTWYLDRDGFQWYSVFPGTLAALLGISIIGMTANRQLPADPDLPEGATAVRTETVDEQIARTVRLAGSEIEVDMFAEGGQVTTALKFVGLMRDGRYEDALVLADPIWIQCRIQARLWNIHLEGSLEFIELEGLAESLASAREPRDFWDGYVQAESEQFRVAWRELDPDNLGAASRRRRIARDYDLVVLTPLGANTDGYFVTSATALPNAYTFLMHRVDGVWLVANHLGTAPPTAGWPPVWWSPMDHAFDGLPEADPVTPSIA